MVHLMAHFEYVWYAVQCEQPKPSWHVDLGISTLAEHNLIRLGLAKCKGLDSEKAFQAFLAFPWSTLDAETGSAIPWKPYKWKYSNLKHLQVEIVPGWETSDFFDPACWIISTLYIFVDASLSAEEGFEIPGSKNFKIDEIAHVFPKLHIFGHEVSWPVHLAVP